MKPLITAVLTLIGGTLLFLFSQVITEGIIKPYVGYRKLFGEITFTLVNYANVIVSAPGGSKPDEQAEISAKLRGLSARLRASITELPFQSLLRCMRLIPSQNQIREAAGLLIRISGRLLETQKKHDEIYQDMMAIGPLLQIDVARG